MLQAMSDFFAQFDFTMGSSAAIDAAVSGSTAAIEQSFGFDSSLGQLAVNSVGNVN